MQNNFGPILIANILTALTTHAWLKTFDPVSLRVAVPALLTIPLIANYAVTVIAPSSASSPALFLASFYLLLIASVCAYRLSPFHPLAKYPGPIILKLTKLWSAWIAYHGKTHVYVKALHDRYGPIVRIGPNELSTTEKELIPQILGNQGMPKGPQWEGRIFASGGDPMAYHPLIAFRDSRVHAEMRMPWNKALAAEPMRTYEELLILRIIELNSHLKKLCGKGTGRVDIAKWVSYFAHDFMGDWVFSTNFRIMESSDKDGRLETMDNAMYFMSITQHIPWLAAFARSLPIINRWVVKFVDRGIEDSMKRSRTQLKRKDLFYHIGEAVGRSEADFSLIVQNCVLATIAASDTTAATLSNAIYLLLSHPEKYKKLQQEVDNLFTEQGIDLATQPTVDGAEVKMYSEVLGGMKYLNAVINETLRLFPAVPTGLQRAPAKGTSSKTLHAGGIVILLPERNAIIVPPYALHRDPRYFSPDPDAYIPERWLSSTNDEGYVTERDAFIPFSLGPANCVGRSLALIELRYALASLVWNFAMEFDKPSYDPIRWTQDLRDHFISQTGDLNVRITMRRKE